MKSKGTSIKFKVFGYFAVFTAIMLVLLWLLQTVFLQQIYKNIKIASVKDCAESAERNLDESHIAGLSERYDVCIRVIDYHYLNDVINAHISTSNCIVHRLNYPMINQIYEITAYAGGKKLLNITPVYNENMLTELDKLEIQRRREGMETIIYSVISKDKLILIESTISPVGATIETLRIELYWVTGILIIIAFIMAFILSRKTSKPIEKLNESAKLLAQGNYDIDFSINGYREVEELGSTLNIAEVELSKVENLRRELLANISHDLRTPLTMITGYAEVMRDIPGEQTPENVQVIIDEATRLTTLVNDLLDISKLQSGVQTLNQEVYNFTQEVDDILKRYAKLIEQNQYSIDFEFDKEVKVFADKSKIDQVIYNLINNAVNYTGADKKVLIRQIANENTVRLEVTDTGAGIEPEQLKYIWDRYYKLDKNHKRAQIGTGLGLSIVRGVMELHNGKYGVISDVGRGSTFWFELNIFQENEQ